MVVVISTSYPDFYRPYISLSRLLWRNLQLVFWLTCVKPTM